MLVEIQTFAMADSIISNWIPSITLKPPKSTTRPNSKKRKRQPTILAKLLVPQQTAPAERPLSTARPKLFPSLPREIPPLQWVPPGTSMHGVATTLEIWACPNPISRSWRIRIRGRSVRKRRPFNDNFKRIRLIPRTTLRSLSDSTVCGIIKSSRWLHRPPFAGI